MIQRFTIAQQAYLAELIAVVFLQKQPFFDKFSSIRLTLAPGCA